LQITEDYKKDALIEKDHLLAIQEALVGFLMDEVINPQGKHHYDNHPIDRLTSEESQMRLEI
jgi:hypothetical protein